MNLSKILSVIVSFIAFAVFYAVSHEVAQNPFSRGSVERLIQDTAAKMNQRLPLQVDPFTRWERVEPGQGKEYSNIYTISTKLTDAEKRLVQDAVTHQTLANPELKSLFDAGITIWYKYYDSAGKCVLEFAVKK